MSPRPIIQKAPNRVNQKLRDSAQDAPNCFGCGIANPNRDILCLAHSNRLQDGKGRGIKATDATGAILCQLCHDTIDGRNGQITRERAQALHQEAHLKTLAWWRKIGIIEQ